MCTTYGFPGSDHILKLLADGPPSQRIGFTVDGKMPVREGALLYAGDTQIGNVTSGGFSPSCEVPIGMGYVTDMPGGNTSAAGRIAAPARPFALARMKAPWITPCI